MSWSIHTGVLHKNVAEEVLNELEFNTQFIDPNLTAASIEQFKAAKRAALELLKTLPGPAVSISFTGHANGTGWQGPHPGTSTEFIHVNVAQHMSDISAEPHA